MMQNLKALVVVLGLGLPCLWLLRNWASQYMQISDYRRRCGVWTGITAAAFIMPDYWMYCMVSVPLLWWAGKSDRNPIALVLFLLHVVPPVSVELPIVGINRLFDINHYRWMTLLILMPALARQPASRLPTSGAIRTADAGIVGYLALSIGLIAMYTSVTDIMRSVVVQFIEVVLAYYAFSRLVLDRRAFREAFACFAIAAAPIAMVGVWEWGRHWLLYTNLYSMWGSDSAVWSWIFRGGELRAQSSTGHSMALAFVTAMALALWMGAVDWAKFHWRQAVLPLVILAGCAASLSRGGWVVAALAYVVFLLIGPLGPAQIFRQLLAVSALSAVVVLQPGGEKFIDMLPFVGSDTGNIDYREQLAELSWKLVWHNPWFGDPFVMRHMESLRQGQGIIDLVNVYAAVALFNGFVGLTLFLVPAAAALAVVLRKTFQSRRHDNALWSIAAALSAALIGVLVMFTVGSFGTSLAYFYWALLGLSVGMTRFDQETLRRPAHSNAPVRAPRAGMAMGTPGRRAVR